LPDAGRAHCGIRPRQSAMTKIASCMPPTCASPPRLRTSSRRRSSVSGGSTFFSTTPAPSTGQSHRRGHPGAVAKFHRHQSVRRVLLRAGHFPGNEASNAAGRSHHKQRIDLLPGAASQRGRLFGLEERHHRADPGDCARRTGLRHHLRPDRHRQCEHRNDERHGEGNGPTRWHYYASGTHDAPRRMPSRRCCSWRVFHRKQMSRTSPSSPARWCSADAARILL
jgi:hypothetical protein